MQIDFHHALNYVVARFSGFAHRQAELVAYCSQYVDDASNSGIIHFDNGAMFNHTSSAHKTLDNRNFIKLATHLVWLPFHFLPGNGGKSPGENPEGTFIAKIVCSPNSPVARDMVSACLTERSTPYGLHRLGITLHTLADTWSHQGFAGVSHAVNDVRALDDHGEVDRGYIDALSERFGDFFDKAASQFVGTALPLGHGAALDYPDLPFLRWHYRDHEGRVIRRDNLEDFTRAAGEMCTVMQRFRAADPQAQVPGLSEPQRRMIREMLATTTDPGGEKRHRKWLAAIAEGAFGFPPVGLAYRDEGTGSWKHAALGTRRRVDAKREVFPYDPSFLQSDWKLFHDALLAHRFTLIHVILPRYGICAA